SYQGVSAIFGKEFVRSAAMDTLIVDKLERKPGETITFQARGFTAGSSVYLVFANPTHAGAWVEQVLTASADGRIAGTIQVPADALGGPWVLVAFDVATAQQALRALIAGTSTNVSGVRVAAATVTVPVKLYLPQL